MQSVTFVVTAVVEGELRAPEPGDPGDPGEPGFNEADEGGLDRLVLVEPEKESLKLGFCLPDKLDFPSTSLSSGSFTGDVEVNKKWSFPPFKFFTVFWKYKFTFSGVNKMLSYNQNTFLFYCLNVI